MLLTIVVFIFWKAPDKSPPILGISWLCNWAPFSPAVKVSNSLFKLSREVLLLNQSVKTAVNYTRIMLPLDELSCYLNYL